MRLSNITLALRQERRERIEQVLKDQDRDAWRELMADKRAPTEDRRNEITGY